MIMFESLVDLRSFDVYFSKIGGSNNHRLYAVTDHGTNNENKTNIYRTLIRDKISYTDQENGGSQKWEKFRMGYIPNELSADEARNLYSQGEISEAEARHLSGGSYDPCGKEHHCVYNGCGQKGYWDSDDRWHYVKDDD